MSDTRTPQPTDLKSVTKSLRIVEALKELDGAELTELTDYLGWPKSTVHVHLQTLYDNKFIVKENGEYVLGLKFLDLGEYVRNRKELYSIVEPKLQELADETGERIHFVVRDHNDCVFVRITGGEHSVNTGSRLGLRRENLHATAAGKAMLASMPEAEVQEILDEEGLPAITPNTITDEAELLDALDDIRDRGIAFNDEEHIEGLRGVGTAIEDPDGNLVGAISLGAPVHRMRAERMREELPDLILSIRTGIEFEIAH